MKNKLLFIVNNPEFFLSHRLPVARAAKDKGYEVHVATAAGKSVNAIESDGFIHHILPLSRSGTNPFQEAISFLSIFKLFLKIRPDITHLVTIKPVLYGSIAARLVRPKGVVAAVSGLGTIFIAGSFKRKLLKLFIKPLYKFAFGCRNLIVIFQNPDDKKTLKSITPLSEEQCVMIPGSGVDLSEYSYITEPSGTPVIAMASRLLKDKGVFEYVEAAEILKNKGVMARFLLIGDMDRGNPSSVTENDISLWEQNGAVELYGYRKDIASLFSEVNIVVLPSYREGMPKVLLEAAAAGRAVVTTDTPGCRDAVIEGKTGILVPLRDSFAIAGALEYLISNPEIRKNFGIEGRKLAEKIYSIENVVNQHLIIYNKLVSLNTGDEIK